MIRVGQSVTEFLNSLITLERMRAVTHARIPLNAWAMSGVSMNPLRKAATARIIISGPDITPRVARTAPTAPAFEDPTKVAVLTAITPGVHWPTA